MKKTVVNLTKIKKLDKAFLRQRKIQEKIFLKKRANLIKKIKYN